MHVISKKAVSKSPCLAKYFLPRTVLQYKTVYSYPGLTYKSYRDTALQKLSTCPEDAKDTLLPLIEPVMSFDDIRSPLNIISDRKILYSDQKILYSDQKNSFADMLIRKKKCESGYKDAIYAVNQIIKYITNKPECIDEFFKKYHHIFNRFELSISPFLIKCNNGANSATSVYQVFKYVCEHRQNDQKITLRDSEFRKPLVGLCFTLGAYIFPYANLSSVKFLYNRGEDLIELSKKNKDARKKSSCIDKDKKEQQHTQSNTHSQQSFGIKDISTASTSESSPISLLSSKTGSKSQERSQ